MMRSRKDPHTLDLGNAAVTAAAAAACALIVTSSTKFALLLTRKVSESEPNLADHLLKRTMVYVSNVFLGLEDKIHIFAHGCIGKEGV